ncbi:12192_t:CDS:2 [Entrophospora sp. SA101]|nr:12192_t:CDS:2 [Entrophospora sp. SA101]
MGFNNLKNYQTDFFQGIMAEREKGIYQNWEEFLNRTINLNIEVLLTNSKNIFRYLQIKSKVLTSNSRDLPFLALPVTNNQGQIKLAKKGNCKLTSLLETFPKIAEYSNQEIVINIYAIIYQLEKKSENDYTLLLQDVRSSFKLTISANIYQEHSEKLVIHNELLFEVKIRISEGKVGSLICEKILD